MQQKIVSALKMSSQARSLVGSLFFSLKSRKRLAHDVIDSSTTDDAIVHGVVDRGCVTTLKCRYSVN